MMISRLTACAAAFAVFATASIAFAASTQSTQQAHKAAADEAKAMPVVQLETIVVTGKRANLTEQ